MKIMQNLYIFCYQKKSIAIRSAAIFASLIIFGNAYAQSSSATASDSKIVSVTLYPGSATIERIQRISNGAKQITFNCLPTNLDVQSLAIEANDIVRVGEISVSTESNESTKTCANTALLAKIATLEEKKAALTAESEAIGFVTSYLKSISNKDVERSDMRFANDAKTITSTADTLRKTALESLLRINEINRQQEILNESLKPLLAEQNRSKSNQYNMKSVTVTISALKELEIKLKYQINGPSWTPTYRAMLDSATGNLKLERQAIVAQSTGEDWSNVKLKLSTGQPQRRLSEPPTGKWNIGIAAPIVLEKRSDNRQAFAMPAAAPAPVAASVAGFAREEVNFDVSMFSKSFATEFIIPQAVSVASNGQRVTFALGAIDSKTRIYARTYPSSETSAYMIAEMQQPEGIWPAGPLHLYRDGSYIGKDTLQIGGKLPLNLSFGRDELITVSNTPEKDARGTTGFTGSREQRTINRSFTVENRHKTAMSIQVIEASPVSIDEQVKIETQFDPKPITTSWREQSGLVLWTTELDPGKSARFTADYAISFPKDARLQERR